MNSKFKKLPKYKVLIVWYSKDGKVTNEKKIDECKKNYYLTDILAHGKQDNEFWADVFCEKRDEPVKS